MTTKKNLVPVGSEQHIPKAPRKSRAKKITEAQANAILDNAASNRPLEDVVKETKKRVKSARPRDDEGRVVRKGRNLSGNQPFRRKPYYFDLDVKKTPNYDMAFSSAPGQVRLLLKYMENNGITTPDDAMTGGEICGGAINSGALQSKIEPASLFAYYRRVMETLGLRLATGEGLAGEEGEE